ncbi:hypothetical protein WA1_13330 [Scytonema hofmannii PCC 7110]|uniref:Uncharacterized protein n=1 Tax=Scytonema hofmannii PCC 7110 TaxID=128403 RepID=A0A139XEG4_9CYAN|nr:hypothetical protein [Scytonema hofmannii]KYC43078.1 hypothetical protein WA1_13330 [Scytonema hofmannii PCC 7110]
MATWFNSHQNRIIIADTIAKAWGDLQYKTTFIAEPKRILQEAGVENIPETIEIQVVENTLKRQYFILSEDFSTHDYNELMVFIQSLSLQPGKEIVLVQNTENWQYIVLSAPPEYKSENADFLTASTLEEMEALQGGVRRIPSVVNSQVVVNKQVLVAVNSAVAAKTKVFVRG